MTRFVLDASVALAWFFEDEVSPVAELALDSLRTGEAVVPPIWPLEVANAFLAAERRGRIKEAGTAHSLAAIRELRIRVAAQVQDPARLLTLARAQGLSAYDAAYLDLAMQEGLPLATLDASLRRAARRLGVGTLCE